MTSSSTNEEIQADFIRIEIRSGGTTRVVQMDAKENGPIVTSLKVDTETADHPTGPAGMIETHSAGATIRLSARANSYSGKSVREAPEEGSQ